MAGAMTRNARAVLQGLATFLLFLALMGGGGALASDLPDHPKIDFGLLAQAPGVPQALRPQTGVRVDGDRVLAVVEHTAPEGVIVERLGALGVDPEVSDGGLLKAWIPVGRLVEVAELPDVVYVRRPHAPVALDLPDPRLTSEGITLLGASLFHAKGVLGQGVRVAVIDLGFGSLGQIQRMGEIHPEAVAWTRDYTGTGLEEGGRHGTAVAQVVHNMAPRAQLYLARIADEMDLSQAVLDCILNDVDIIVHSVGWVNTSFGDGTGVVADITRRAEAAGILWVNAAGNHAQRHWLGTPRIGLDGWLEFAPGVRELELRVDAEEFIQVALTWNEWPRAASDLDLYLYNERGSLVAVSRNRQTGSVPPTEFLGYFGRPGTYTVRVRAHRARDPVRVKLFSLWHPLTPHVARSSILEPANAAEVFTVGTIGLSEWPSGPQQPYSSQGPTADGRVKPDLMGLDGVTNFAYPVFFGTSAAAPHVAGGAALLLSQARRAGRDLGREELTERLVRWAVDLGPPGPDPVFGEGRLRLFVEEVHAERSIAAREGEGASGGRKLTVEVAVRMPGTRVGGLELRERLPAGLTGSIVDPGGSHGTEQGETLSFRWDVALPGETHTVRYTVAIPEDFPAGTYAIIGDVNGDPVGGDAALSVDPAAPEARVTVLAAPNPVAGGPVRFTVGDTEAWEVRLRVHDLSGLERYDSGWQPGPSYQWHLQDSRGRIVAGGVYLYWVEVRTPDGQTVRTRVERLLVVR